MCHDRIGAYFSLLKPGETGYTACHPRTTTTYILHVVPITTRTKDRRKSIGQKKPRKDKKKKERKDKKGTEKKKKRQEKQEKTRQEEARK